jgi:hypothetical protein
MLSGEVAWTVATAPARQHFYFWEARASTNDESNKQSGSLVVNSAQCYICSNAAPLSAAAYVSFQKLGPENLADMSAEFNARNGPALRIALRDARNIVNNDNEAA